MNKGMIGFSHTCSGTKVEISNFKKSIKDSSFSEDEIIIVWDFYVTHNVAGGTGIVRSLQDYNWDIKNKRDSTLLEIEKGLMQIANIDRLCCIRSKKIDNTLIACDLSSNNICIEHPRAVLRQKHTLTVDENERINFAGGGQNRIDCIFEHIRNSLAHSNTYFFENGNVLLEDKDGSTITARIIISKQTLLDWIYYIDKDSKYYIRDLED